MFAYSNDLTDQGKHTTVSIHFQFNSFRHQTLRLVHSIIMTIELMSANIARPLQYIFVLPTF
ncbi:hypothetical protein BLOT_013097 [Blomia tropicalis]|nr:hypothetical protein BLOT_013097 [Blomia tropicalis]